MGLCMDAWMDGWADGGADEGAMGPRRADTLTHCKCNVRRAEVTPEAHNWL